jgi:putative membrane protein
VGALYHLGVRRLAGRGRVWPAGRRAAMAGALVAGVVATQSGIGRYEADRFWVHMVQPVTLALQTGAPGTRRVLRAALHGRVGRVAGHPLVGWTLFGGGLVALYLTPLLDLSARNDLVHVTVHAHVVASGVLFLAPLAGVDPLPSRPPFAARLLVLLVSVPFHAIVALALISARSPAAPDAYPSLGDQRTAAALFWGSGELLTLVVAAVISRQWWVSEQRAAARDDRLATTDRAP